MRNDLWIYGVLIIFISVSSCYQSENFNPELERSISIEGLQSDSLGRVLILENDQYPCVIPGRCEPSLVKDALVFLEGSQSPEIQLMCDNTCSIYLTHTPTSFSSGEIITMSISLDGKIYTASGAMPDSLDMVLATRYDLDVNFPGLLLKLDTVALKQSNGLYILFITQNSTTINFGFLITEDRFASSAIPNNGQYVAQDEYYISDEEIQASGVVVLPGDTFQVVARHITPESAEFYRSFKETLARGNINLNNGLLFAPPDNLPSNFDNGGFGFFHIFYEQLTTGIVR